MDGHQDSVTLFKEIRGRYRLGVLIGGGMFAMCAAVHVIRAAYFAIAPPVNDLFAPVWMNSALFVAATLSVACCSIGWTVLVDERLATDLHDTSREAAKAMEENAALEAELRQAQKLETMGRLAGGVAHDFNNVLSVVNSYSDLLLQRVGSRHPLSEGLNEIHKAGQLGALLTQQLLTFCRKESPRPTALNLNQVTLEAVNMLRCLIGERIELLTVLSPELGLVIADACQLNQVLMNLAVNARDAMPNGGQLHIETANIDFERGFTSEAPEIEPGHYVQLMVSDTGVGMDRETLAHLFEPLFSTKKRGDGTGLGLATVHKIVHQAGGSISVCSEVGKGSSFRIYLPRLAACDSR